MNVDCSRDHFEQSPEFSLIIATVGPATNLRRGLASIVKQSYASFEVIVVDQNVTDHVCSIVAEFHATGKVRHIRCQVGLSRSRNAGLALARGRIVGFPDDDCEYPVTLLADVKARFLSHEHASGICVRCCDHGGHDSAGRSDRKNGVVTKSNIWIRAVSVGIFLKTDAVRAIDGFDETLGLGSNTPYQSGEETDLLLRLISCGCTIYYDPSLEVFHPRVPLQVTKYHIQNAYSYGLGMGLVLKRHNYRFKEVSLHCLRPILGAVFAIIIGNWGLARLRYERAKGRIDGWRSSVSSAFEGQ